MKLKKKLLMSDFNLMNYFLRLAWPCLILLVSMVIFVDQITIYWLVVFSLFYLYKGRYKDLRFYLHCPLYWL